MSLYEIGKCSYCGEGNRILKPSPFMADMNGMMCKYCWDETQKEYAASNGEYISDFDSEKNEYDELLHKINKRDIICPAIYKHFKNKYYATMGIPINVNEAESNKMCVIPHIITFTAKHTETGNIYAIFRNKKKFYIYDKDNNLGSLVLYKSLYDGHIPYIRPLDMFLSKVDKEKYPKVKQEYRFELYLAALS